MAFGASAALAQTPPSVPAPLANYGAYNSPDLAYGSTGAGGWSAPGGVILGGGFRHYAGETVHASFPAEPSTQYPHYTYGPDEYGWNVYNGGTPGNISVHGLHADMPPGYGILQQTISGFSPGGWAGWSVPAGKVVLGGGYRANGPVAVSAPAGPDTVWPHYTYGADEYGWVVRSAGATEITVYAIYADMPAGYEIVKSVPMDFSSTGWAGWSIAGPRRVVTGGGFELPGPAYASLPWLPGQTTPFGYTYGANEYGWLVQNGGTPGTGYVYVIYADRQFAVEVFASDGTFKSGHATIQAAINAATTVAGNEIRVGPGTYLETINLNKANLTLRSTDGAAVTTIRGGGQAAAGDAVVRFEADGVTLDGFTIDRNNAAADSRAIAPMASDGATIANNVIVNSFRGVQGDFYGRPDNLTISGNTFESSVQYGIAGTEDVDNLTVSDNTFRTTAEGIGLGVGLTGLSISGNTFASTSGSHIAAYGAGLMPDYATLLAANTFGKAATVSATTGADGTTQGIYSTIQAAIDAAAPGATINVTAGTYAEALVINKAVTLLGPNADKAGDAADRDPEAILTFPQGLGTGYHYLVDIYGNGTDVVSDVAVRGFTLQDNLTVGLPYSAGYLAAGLYSEGDNTLVENNRFSGFNYISVRMSRSGASNATTPRTGNITRNNYIENPTIYAAIYYQASSGLIEGNKVVNAGSGIQIQPYYSGSTGTVRNNELLVNTYGLWYNYANTTPVVDALWSFEGNSVTAATNPDWSLQTFDGLPRPWNGIRIETYLQNPTTHSQRPAAHFANNTIDATGAASGAGTWPHVSGVFFRNVRQASEINTSKITFANNTFSNVEIGARLTDLALEAGAIANYDLAQLAGNGNTFPAGMVVFASLIDNAPATNLAQARGYATIQAAIDAAAPGDTIEVAPGTYAETISLNKADLTLRSAGGAAVTTIRGGGQAAAGDAVVRFEANGVTLDGFTIDRNNAAADSRAIAPMASDGAKILNNVIVNAMRGVQGDFYGRPKNLTISGNTFAASVQYGIAGTEDMAGLTISGNTFRTSVEGIGLGGGVGLAVTLDELFDMQAWQLSGGYPIKDYRVAGEPIFGAPSLSIPTDLLVAQGERNIYEAAGVNLDLVIPVLLDPGAFSLSAATFAVDLNGSCVAAAADAAVQPGASQPASTMVVAFLNSTYNTFDIAIYADEPLVAGELVTIQARYNTSNDCLNPAAGSAPLAIVADDPAPSFGSPDGASLSASPSQNGSITPRWGDCDGSGVVDADDILACRAEIFDRDGVERVDARYSGVASTIFGDSNQDLRIDVGDLICTGRALGSLACSTDIGDNSNNPYLSIATGLEIEQGAANGALPAGVELNATIPVHLNALGHELHGATFALDLSNSCFSVADVSAVQLAEGQPGSATLYANLNATHSALDIAIYGAALNDGHLLNVQVSYSSSSDCLNPAGGSTPVAFVTGDPAPSFSTEQGASIAADASVNGSLTPRWGDCNGDGSVDAGDISACIQEIFDRDGSSRVAARYSGFTGTIFCDSNQDVKIDAGDIVCTVRTINELSCGAGIAAASAAPASVTLANASLSGQMVSTINLSAGGQAAAAMFALAIDPAYSLDASDADGDGLPDALQMSLPADYQAMASYDADTRLLQLLVISFNPTAAPLNDGPLATLALTGAGPAQAVTIQEVSLGGINGESLPVQGGVVVEMPEMNYRLFVPTVIK